MKPHTAVRHLCHGAFAAFNDESESQERSKRCHTRQRTRVGELSPDRQAAQRHSLSRENDVRTFGPNPHSFRGGGARSSGWKGHV
jgi:hypothetical protein